MKTNKPVAWMNCNTGSELSMDLLPAVLFDKLIIDNKQDWIPLYTHPVKELTDEEILKLEEIEFDNYCVDKESKGRKTATITDPEWAIWFARAILRKAQDR